MDKIAIIPQKPSAADYCRLRKAVGWPVPDEAACAAALANSVLGVVALANNDVIGMGRVVGDGVLWNYIQDLIVLPEYQKRGIGRRMMEILMDELTRRASGGSDVALISAPQAVGFYERFSFTRCTPDKPAMRRKI